MFTAVGTMAGAVREEFDKEVENLSNALKSFMDSGDWKYTQEMQSKALYDFIKEMETRPLEEQANDMKVLVTVCNRMHLLMVLEEVKKKLDTDRAYEFAGITRIR